MAMEDITGRSFDAWTALRFIEGSGSKHPKWKCVCKCGNVRDIDYYALTGGRTRSCGCLRQKLIGEKTRTHGKARTKIYSIWVGIITRCCNPNTPNFCDYGGRGITVCDRWRNSFENFYSDMGERPRGMSIERIDNDAGYSPENCKWATRAEQSRNRRNNRRLTLNGETRCLAEWSKITGLNPITITSRLKRGWSEERALTEKLKKTQNKKARSVKHGLI